MKKLFLALGLVAAVSVSAAEYQVIPMLSVSSINMTNAIGVTNLNSGYAWSTNVPLMYYTNRSGTRVTTAASSYQNLLGDAELWGFDNNFPLFWGNSSGGNSTNTPVYFPAQYNIITKVGKYVTEATTVTFVFKPLFGDDQRGMHVAYNFNVAVAASQTVDVITCTPVPLYKWPGARAVRLEAIYVTAAGTSGQYAPVTEVSLVGWR